MKNLSEVKKEKKKIGDQKEIKSGMKYKIGDEIPVGFIVTHSSSVGLVLTKKRKR